MKKHKILTVVLLHLFLATPSVLQADEGLWFPSLVKQENYKKMKSLGLQLRADELYSHTQTDLTEAVVALTSEGQELHAYASAGFISPEGLLITNHHVVLNYIERFSSDKNDFMQHGYWARNNQEESLCRGLQATLLVHQKDVTKALTKGVEKITDANERNKIINSRSKALSQEMERLYPGSISQTVSCMAGNSYILNTYMVYKDVRMVAAPPMQIGRYAGANDNWQWPRHTGDFAILRVYADSNNLPAKYAKENIPYRPAKWLSISKQGIQEGDFAMLIGYPNNTRRYIPSFALDKIINEQMAARVKIREGKLALLKEAVEENPMLRLRYTNRMHSIENSYLRWKGEIEGVQAMNLIAEKEREEASFQKWAEANPKRKLRYGNVLEKLRENYNELGLYNYVDVFFQEAGLQGAEIVPIAGKFEKLMAMFARKHLNKTAITNEANKLHNLTNQYYYNWDYELDRKMFRDMIWIYMSNVPTKFYSKEMLRIAEEFDGDIEAYSKHAYANSILTHQDSIRHFLEHILETGNEPLLNDPVYQLSIGYYRVNVNHIARQRALLQEEQIALYSTYLKGYMEWKKGEKLYPDANRTMRYGYGTIQSVKGMPAQTYLSELVAKADAHGDSAAYHLPRKLRDQYQAKAFGEYANQQGEIPVNFISNCHTSSGSSGSPVLNGKGELIGINFDRFVEGVASDYNYMPELCRSIAVDVRYILFILEKYSPSSHLINELDIH